MSKTNLIGATKLPNKNGTPKAVATFSTLAVNNNYTPSEVGNNHVLRFPTNIYGEFGINKLSKAMNDIQFQTNQFGLSANVTIFIPKTESDAQFLYFSEKIKKGSRLHTVHATTTFDEKYGLQITIAARDVSFIKDPEGTEQSAEGSSSETGGPTAAELMESHNQVDYDVDETGV